MGTEQNGREVVIETRRLRLRSYRETDLLQLVSLINNWEVARWVSTLLPHPYTEAHGREWIASVQAEHVGGKRKLSRGLAPVVSEKLLRLKPAGCRVAEAAFEVCQ
jgi:hypothetical protein